MIALLFLLTVVFLLAEASGYPEIALLAVKLLRFILILFLLSLVARIISICLRPPSRDTQNNLLTRLISWIDYSEWPFRLLGLAPSGIPNDKPGLIFIQIDGLSKTQLNRALNQGKMPFLKRLLKQNYCLFNHYSGLPSSTPNVQGELFYGVRQIIPSFSYYDQENAVMTEMYDAASVKRVEKKLQKHGKGLLEGGSSYSNVFAGGARESHFCAANLDFFELIRHIHPMRKIIFAVIHSFDVIGILVLMCWETLISFADFLLGIFQGKNFFLEFQFIFSRAFLCILLRELVAIGVQMDIARGLPIIHANFLGYDEQSHRRGPSSKFAHWTLNGIDGSVKRIYEKALHKSPRHYDVWIYSDHGQETVISYIDTYKKTVGDAVKAVLETGEGGLLSNRASHGVQFHRLRYLRPSGTSDALKNLSKNFEKNMNFIVTAIGPVGNIYFSSALNPREIQLLAQKLVQEAHIPMVATNDRNTKIHVWTREGVFMLPDNAAQIFGPHHPYLKEITRDFMSLCRHPDAGTLTIIGWQKNGEIYSFPRENGSHAGPGIEETNAFALLPCDVVKMRKEARYLTTSDLREAALNYLGQSRYNPAHRPLISLPNEKRHAQTLKIMTFNVHSCVGMDGKLSVERIAHVIARHEPDIVALQELDIHRVRTDHFDQPHKIAKHLEMFYHFHPSFFIEEEQYGNAVLSKFPLKIIKAGRLPFLSSGPRPEKRSILWTEIDIEGNKWQVMNTHLSLNRKERLLQAEEIIGPEWLGHPKCRGPVVLCGDLNSLPGSKVCQKIEGLLTNSTKSKWKKYLTWASSFPICQIDHIFVGPGIAVKGIRVSKTDLDKMASDHLPLIAEIEVPGANRLVYGRLRKCRS